MSEGPRPQSATTHWRLLLVLSMAHLLTDFAQGAIPALSGYLTALYDLTYSQWGTVMLVSMLSSSLVQPLLGMYVDRLRNGWFIPLGLMFSSCGLMGIALSQSYEWLLLSVAVGGLGVGMFHPEGMRGARLLTGQLKTTGMSVFQVGGNIGYGLGPTVAAVALAVAGITGLIGMALPTLLWGLLIIVLLPQLRAIWRDASSQPARARPAAGTDAETAGGIAAPQEDTRNRWDGVVRVLGVVFLRSAFQFALVSFIPLYFIHVLHGSPEWAGMVLSLYLVSGAVGTLVGGPIADRIGVRRYLLLAMAVVPPLHILTLVSPPWLAAVWLAGQGAALVSTYAASIVLTQSFLPRNLGLASGLNVGLGMALGGIGAVIAGLLADHFGLTTTMYLLTLFPVLGAVVATRLPGGPRATVPAPATPGQVADSGRK